MFDNLALRLPSYYQSREGRTFARFISPDRTHDVKLSLEAEQPCSLPDSPEFEFVDRRTIVVLDRRLPGQGTTDLIPRVRLSALEPLRNLNLGQLLAKSDPTSQRQEQLRTAFKTATWCTTETARKNLHRFATLISRSKLAGLKVRPDSVLEVLRQELHSSSDDCLATDILEYVSTLMKLAEILDKYPGWHAIDAAPQELRQELLNLAEQVRYRSNLELTSALAVSLLDAAGERKEAALLADIHRTHTATELNLAETGVRSYGTVPEVDCPFGVSFQDLVGDVSSTGTSQTTILYSGNPDFLRAYLPRIFFFMTVFSEYHYHFALVGSDAECRSFASEMQQLWRETCSMKRLDPSGRLSISYCEMPAGLPRPVSFLASARFYFVQQHLGLFPNGLWIHDVDLFPSGDFRPYVSEVPSGIDISLPKSSWLQGVIPWKRAIACNVLFNPTTKSQRFMDRVVEYLNYWLVNDGSWMVDQNALSYAFSAEGEISTHDFLASKIPLQQSTLANLFESTVGES